MVGAGFGNNFYRLLPKLMRLPELIGNRGILERF